jgi:hypothetical protein
MSCGGNSALRTNATCTGVPLRSARRHSPVTHFDAIAAGEPTTTTASAASIAPLIAACQSVPGLRRSTSSQTLSPFFASTEVNASATWKSLRE